MWEIALPLRFPGALPEHPTDAQLAEECRRGNLRAFKLLYQQHASRMKSLAFRLLGSRADAEDAVQEAFLKVHKAMSGFEGHSSLATWVYRILLNCCYDALRRRDRLAGSAAPLDFPTPNKVPLKLALERALALLNDRQRLVFLMFEVEGLKHSEIAAILVVPEGTSRSWLFEAKSNLKRILTETPR